MPKLPRILVTEGVAPVGGARIPFGAGESGVGAIGATLTSVADAYGRAEQRLAEIERKQQTATATVDADEDRDRASLPSMRLTCSDDALHSYVHRCPGRRLCRSSS